MMNPNDLGVDPQFRCFSSPISIPRRGNPHSRPSFALHVYTTQNRAGTQVFHCSINACGQRQRDCLFGDVFRSVSALASRLNLPFLVKSNPQSHKSRFAASGQIRIPVALTESALRYGPKSWSKDQDDGLSGRAHLARIAGHRAGL